jgi:AbrB family looped-hinge helix DNA binding protein
MNAVTTEGRVTIPEPIRDALGIRPGRQVEFTINRDGEVALRKADAERPHRPQSRGLAPMHQYASN